MKCKLDKGAHSVYALQYHLILIVKYRREVFTSNGIIDFFRQKANETSDTFGVEILNQECSKDHVHIIFKARPTLDVPKYLNALKTITAREISGIFLKYKKNYGRRLFDLVPIFLQQQVKLPSTNLKNMWRAKVKKMQITYKFRLYPNKEHEEKLLETLELCRQTYNYFLFQWNEEHKKPSKLDLQAQLPKLKSEKSDLNNVYSKVLQMVLYQLYSNLKALSQLKKNGKKVGKLRYKGKGWFKTFIYNQFGFKLVKTGKRLDLLHLSKIGDIPIRLHREVKGKIKQIIIKKHNSGKWFACVSVEERNHVEKKETKKAVGIDMGIKHFLTDSAGRQIENPKFYERTLEKIKGAQKKLSRKKRGSKNREKQRVKLVKLYEKLENQRNDFLHKLSKFYVSNYDLIAVEDLNIKNMVRNHRLAGKILDASWGKFLHMLHYKAENAGGVVVKVISRGTSREYKHGMLDRDYNASLNIPERGLSGMGHPSEPVEIEPLPRVISASTIIEAGSPMRSVG